MRARIGGGTAFMALQNRYIHLEQEHRKQRALLARAAGNLTRYCQNPATGDLTILGEICKELGPEFNPFFVQSWLTEQGLAAPEQAT
jgi:hypothetical protein